MSVDAFRLENFMAFKDTGWLELRRINLVLGRNSSGKTAFIRALRLMKQSLLSAADGQALTLTAEGGIDLGSFDVILHRSSESEAEKPETHSAWTDPITFSFRGSITRQSFPEKEEGDTQWGLIRRFLAPDETLKTESLHYEVNAAYRWDWSQDRFFIAHLGLRVASKEAASKSTPVIAITAVEDKEWEDNEYKSEVQCPSLPGAAQRLFKLDSQLRFLPSLVTSELIDEVEIEDQERAEALRLFWMTCSEEIDGFLRSIVYIGPIRPCPERYYIITQEMYDQFRQSGWQFFLDYLEAPVAERWRFEKINRWIERMELGVTLQPDNLIDGRKGSLRAAVDLKVDERGLDEINDKRSLVDMGYGASQILPIIIACSVAPLDAFILIEQPELHLHPKAQADIADLLISSINENVPARGELHPKQLDELRRQQRGNQIAEQKVGQISTRRFLVETHSETLFLRIRVELAKTGANLAKAFYLGPQQIIGHHVYRDPLVGNSWVEQLLFNNKGSFAQPPKKFGDFFGQDFKESVELEATASAIKEDNDASCF